MASSLNTLTRRQMVEYDVIREMHGDYEGPRSLHTEVDCDSISRG